MQEKSKLTRGERIRIYEKAECYFSDRDLDFVDFMVNELKYNKDTVRQWRQGHLSNKMLMAFAYFYDLEKLR